jgi:two-component sensor histidine kinase
MRDLAGDLAAAAGRDDLQIVLELDAVAIPAASAAAFALVANELLGNALKHAFPPGRAGRIGVSLLDHGETLALTVVDNGVGMSGSAPGFGSTIVKLLCQQLHAGLEVVDAAPGVRVTVTVPTTRAVTP